MCNRDCNVLNVRMLQKCAENRVFAPNIFVKEKKCVVWCIDCCDIWMNNDAKCHAAIRLQKAAQGTPKVSNHARRCKTTVHHWAPLASAQLRAALVS